MSGQHTGIGPHYYANLDEDESYEDSRLRIGLPLREIAEKMEAMNYGVQRFLSHLIDVRREHLTARIKKYEDRGDDDIARYVRREGDPLAEGIEKLLKEGYH